MHSYYSVNYDTEEGRWVNGLKEGEHAYTYKDDGRVETRVYSKGQVM